MIRIEEWSVCSDADMYTPPEAAYLYLHGRVYNHPKFPDGMEVSTSVIRKVDGRLVTTYSGSLYELGEPEERYVEYCRKSGRHVPTQETPIKVIVR